MLSCLNTLVLVIALICSSLAMEPHGWASFY